MAKLNTKVQLSPTNASPKEDQVDKDDLEAGSDDEHTAKTLRMSLNSGKKQASKDTPSNGLIEKVTRFLGLGGQQSVEEMFYSTKGPDNDKLGEADADGEGEEDFEDAGLTATNSVKRRRDTYDVYQAHSEQVKEGGELEGPAQKKAKTIKKAKAPLMPPKRSKAPIATQRQTRASKRIASQEPESEMNPAIPSPARTNVALPNSETQKRGRGRPPKKQAVVPDSDGDLPEVQDIGRRPREHSTDEAGENEDGAEDPAVAEHGVSAILMNPSPVKPIPPERPKSSGRLQKDPKAHPINRDRKQRLKLAQLVQKDSATDRINGELYELSDPGDESEEEEEVAPDSPPPDVPDNEDDQGDELPQTLKDVISIEDLENMLETARTVGYKQDKTTKKWERNRTVEAPLTIPGKRMLRRLEKLVKAYGALLTARTGGNESAENAVQKEITALIENLREESEIVFTERLGNPARSIPYADTQSTLRMLTDIYFFLVPNTVKALKLVVELHQDEELSKTKALQEVFDVLDLLRQLAEGAIRQRQESQPKASKENQYRISSPTRSALPIIRIVHKSLTIELRARDRAKRIAAWNGGAVKRERKRAAEDKKRDDERRRQRIEIYRMQQEVIDAKLKDPFYVRYLQAELKRDEAKARERRMAMQAAKSSWSTNFKNSQRSSVRELDDHDRDMDDDPLDDQYERIKVFPNSSASKYHNPIPLTKEERVNFIEIMRFEKKAVRYEKAARRLGRSLEEIFAFAKELQEAMDLAHEKGDINEPCDEWTYDVFIEQP